MSLAVPFDSMSDLWHGNTALARSDVLLFVLVSSLRGFYFILFLEVISWILRPLRPHPGADRLNPKSDGAFFISHFRSDALD